MSKVLVYSLLLLLGMIGSQQMPDPARPVVSLLTMFALSFIMIHVGYEFEMDKSKPGKYAGDYLIAASAASLPWILCTLYFVFVMAPPSRWHVADQWRAAVLQGLFAAPTSAGVLFSMLAAAGLGASWVFIKARVLAIFDDLHTILLLIPLQAMLIGMHWQLAVTAIIILALLVVAYRYLNRISLPISWPWTMSYAAIIVVVAEMVYQISRRLDPQMPLHLEVLLPAFALGCVLKSPAGTNPHVDDTLEGVEPGPESQQEQAVSTIVSASFMVLVGLSMPPLNSLAGGLSLDVPAPPWSIIALHVLAITALSNIGKMVPAICYRREASIRLRLALAVAMFPRGEVGAGVLLIAIRYGFTGPAITVGVLSLAVNLLLTGLFILIVKRLIASEPTLVAR